jgi:CheY-like chemotaxis protein
MHILVVDRSLLNARTLLVMFESFGCTIALASTVRQAMDIVQNEHIQVIIAGNGFFEQDGTELKAAITSKRPGLCTAAISDPDLLAEPNHAVDFYLRPELFSLTSSITIEHLDREIACRPLK